MVKVENRITSVKADKPSLTAVWVAAGAGGGDRVTAEYTWTCVVYDRTNECRRHSRQCIHSQPNTFCDAMLTEKNSQIYSDCITCAHEVTDRASCMRSQAKINGEITWKRNAMRWPAAEVHTLW